MDLHENQFIPLQEFDVKLCNMAYFSYKIEHDFGLAPNPFGTYCTLSVCRPIIRNNRNLNIGDWIIGTGSVKLNALHHLIYAMQVGEKITFTQYWDDPRFQYKKPVVNGSLVQMYGDNFYHQNKETREWIQENSAHSSEGGLPHPEHIRIDTGGKFVLISQNFYYLGNNSIQIPDKYLEVCSEGRNMKGPSIPAEIADKFILWIKDNCEKGIQGDPISWKKYD